MNIAELIRNGAEVFDVRSSLEYQQGYYKGAINIPLDQISGRLDEFGVKDQPKVLYCKAGVRSAMACQILKASGYTQVFNGGGLSEMP